MPSSTSNQPRWRLESPEDFGHKAKPRWKTARPDQPLDVALLRAAMIQHACVLVIRARVLDQGTTWRQVCQHLHSTGYTQLMRVVRGEATMSLVLLSELSEVFGPTLVYSEDLHLIFQTDWPEPPRG